MCTIEVNITECSHLRQHVSTNKTKALSKFKKKKINTSILVYMNSKDVMYANETFKSWWIDT